MMNAVHDLSVLVARDEGLFSDEGLDVEVIDTVGTARANPVGEALHGKIFDRSLETLYNAGGLDQYRMCEWGVMNGRGDRVRPAPGENRGIGRRHDQDGHRHLSR